MNPLDPAYPRQFFDVKLQTNYSLFFFFINCIHIDIAQEVSRLEKAVIKATQEKTLLEKKLGNDKFMSNAPANVIKTESDKLSKVTSVLRKLEDQLSSLS